MDKKKSAHSIQDFNKVTIIFNYRALVLDSACGGILMPYSSSVVLGISKFIAAVTGTATKLTPEPHKANIID